MSNQIHFSCSVACLILGVLQLSLTRLNTCAQNSDLTDTTAAYQSGALQLLIREANHIAKQLNLKEDLPITETNLVEKYITPPRLARGMKAVGNISTRNYRYFFSIDNKFSFLTLTDLDKDYSRLEDQVLSASLIDTNAAFRLATQFLSAVSMDVPALNRDCRLEILPWTPGGTNFVPVYWVRWYKGRDILAMVELFEPTRTVRQLRVEKAEYILSDPIDIAKLSRLMQSK